MFVDYIQNNAGHGPVGQALAQCRFEPGMMRPYFNRNGIPSVTINTGKTIEKDGKPVPELVSKSIAELMNQGIHNEVLNSTSLRKDEWLKIDQVVIKAARQRLRAWGDLAAANSFGGFNGMSKMMLEHETMSDPGEAIVDMDGITEGRQDSPLYQLEGLPLPITHVDFSFSERRLAVSRNSGTPIDTTMIEAAARRVGETVEKTLIGIETGRTYGDATLYGQTPTVYGYTNFPLRTTKTDMTAPTSSNGTTVLSDWLALRDAMYDAKFYGPFMAYTSTNYDQYLDNDFKTNSDKSLRERLLAIDGINGIRRLDYLTTSSVVILVQMTSDVARAVNGMDITTVQWPSKGGMQLNFKVMAIMVPQLRADYDGNCGIGHGTTS